MVALTLAAGCDVEQMRADFDASGITFAHVMAGLAASTGDPNAGLLAATMEPPEAVALECENPAGDLAREARTLADASDLLADTMVRLGEETIAFHAQEEPGPHPLRDRVAADLREYRAELTCDTTRPEP